MVTQSRMTELHLWLQTDRPTMSRQRRQRDARGLCWPQMHWQVQHWQVQWGQQWKLWGHSLGVGRQDPAEYYWMKLEEQQEQQQPQLQQAL